MSLQSPFGPDVQMQLMGLSGYGQQMPSRDPGDMGTREQFMRMMAENRAQSDQQYQRQMQMMQQGNAPPPPEMLMQQQQQQDALAFGGAGQEFANDQILFGND